MSPMPSWNLPLQVSRLPAKAPIDGLTLASSLRRCGILMIAMVVFSLAPRPVHAQAPDGLDLVVLIDQSGSMWGHPKHHPRPNDQYAHRVDATRAVLERLAADVKGTGRVHRFSIVDFGDEADVRWSNQELRHDPADPEAPRRRLDLEMPLRIRAREELNTNTPEAIATALSELRLMEATQSLPGRRRLVLLITDGRPQKPPADREQMKDNTRREAIALLADGAELWVVGLNDASSYWLEGDGAFWQDVVGDPNRTHLAEKAVPDLPKGVHRMVDSWLGLGDSPSAVPQANGASSYVAPPYLGGLAFRASFSAPRNPTSVRIEAPDGRSVPRVSSGSGSTPSTYARFELVDPPPGSYTIESPQPAPLISPEPHPPEVHRLAPAAGADLAVETRIVFKAILGSGKPLEELVDWPLTTTIDVEPLGDPISTEPMTLEAELKGGGKFVGRWKPSVAGAHRLSLRGLTEVDGQEVDIFANAPGAVSEIDVSPDLPLWLKLERPSTNSSLFVTPWASDTTVLISLLDSEGKKMDPSALVADPSIFLEVEKVDASGVPIYGPLPLEVDSKGRFWAKIPIEPNWWESRGLLGLGELNLRLRAKAEHIPGGHALRGIQLPEAAEGRRIGSDPFSFGPIALEVSRWLAFCGIAILGVSTLGLLTVVAAYLVPAWRIQKKDRGSSLELRIYDLANDPTGAQAQTFPVSGATSCKLDGKVRISIEGESLVADILRLRRVDSPGRAQSRLTYRWAGEKKKKTTKLAAGGGPKTLRVEAAVKGRPVAELIESRGK